MSKNSLGIKLLGIFLILHGILAILPAVRFAYADLLLGVLALVSGVLLLVGR